MMGWMRCRAGMAGVTSASAPRYRYCVQDGMIVFCSEHRKYSGAPWRKYSTLVWGKDEATSRRRFMESLEEALKVRSRVGMHTDVISVTEDSSTGNVGKKCQQAVHQDIEKEGA